MLSFFRVSILLDEQLYIVLGAKHSLLLPQYLHSNLPNFSILQAHHRLVGLIYASHKVGCDFHRNRNVYNLSMIFVNHDHQFHTSCHTIIIHTNFWMSAIIIIIFIYFTTHKFTNNLTIPTTKNFIRFFL